MKFWQKRPILVKKWQFFIFLTFFFENFTFLVDLGGVSDLTSEKKKLFIFLKKIILIGCCIKFRQNPAI